MKTTHSPSSVQAWYGLVVMICLAAACHKSEPISTTRLIPGEMKAYWDFKPGSYWIYQDSVSGEIDSVYVTDYENYKFDANLSFNEKPAHCEYLGFNTHSTLDEYNYSYYINTQWASPQPNYNVVSCSKSKPGDFVDNHIEFVYPFFPGRMSFNSYGLAIDSCIIRTVYDSYGIYQNVVRIDHTLNSFDYYKHTKSFYAKYIGLIRYEVPDSNKYRILIDYHIEP